jgi:hypothetical protein
MALAPIIMPILSVFKSGGVKEASAAVGTLGSKFGGLAKQAGSAAGALAGFQAIASAKDFVNTSIDATQKFERNLLALQQTFETATPAMTGFIKEVENYGLSQQEAAQASVFLGSVLKQYGFSTKQAGVETEKLVTLSQDLATTYGYDVQDALLAVTALFRGEYDPIEKFGVAMKQNEINAYLAAQGLSHLTGAELANAQATARLELLMERAGDSIGAFSRASDTLYGSQQRLNAVMGNLQVAFGSAFQEPLAAVNNALANVAQDGGEQLIDVGQALAGVIEAVVPLVEGFGNVLIGLIAPMEQIIALGAGVAGAITEILTPLLDFTDEGLDQANILFDALALGFKKVNEAKRNTTDDKSALDTFFGPDWNRVGTELMRIDNELDKSYLRRDAKTKLGESKLVDGLAATNKRREDALTGSLAAITEAFKEAAKKNAAAIESYSNGLNALGINSINTAGDLIGIAAAMEEIEIAVEKSKAAEAMDEIGYSAGQIEEILTRPDWEQIFTDIATLAKIAAMEITNSMTVDVMRNIAEARNTLAATIKTSFGAGESKPVSGPSGKTAAKKEAKNYVEEFLKGISEEVMKQTARTQLQNMTGSQGLIESILGAENWLKIWIKIKAGLLPLEDLEKQFYKTAEGAQELADSAQALEDYNDKVTALKEELVLTLAAINDAADALKLSFSDLFSAFDVLPTIAAEMGRFESAIVSQLTSIEAALQSAFRNGDLYEEGYNALRKFARQELAVLQARQRQRDDMASRLSLSEEIIDEYKDAFTGAMKLTSLFNSLKDETEKRTVTEVTTGVAKLGKSLRDFNIVVTREYEETITNVIDKTAGLLDGFKQMSVKAKAFAENLRILKDMGLNGQLFDQLVQAGVEAGGETAQGLVDGGQETVSEISNIFAEVNALGATLGEEVATTLYGTGIDLADGLIEGILSKQDEMEKAAYAMAEAFNTAFQATLSTEIAKVTADREVKAIKETADKIAAIPVPKMPVNQAALKKIEDLIAGATKYIGNVTGSLFEGGTNKLGAFEALKRDVLSGQITDLGGLTSGLTSTNAELIGRGTGGTNVNNYYDVKVTADTRTGGTQAGEAAVQAITRFTQKNGSSAVVSLLAN